MKLHLKLSIGFMITANLLYFIMIFNYQDDLSLITFSIIFLLILDILSFNILDKLIRKGNYILGFVIKIQNNLKEKYGTKLKSDVFNVFYFIRNKSLFNFLLLELSQSSLQLELKSKHGFIKKEKGWLKTFKSSEKALKRYNLLYKEIFENQLKFQISYLITMLSIKNKFFNDIQKTLEKSKLVLFRDDIPKKILPEITMKSKEGFNFNTFREKFPTFSIQEFKAELPSNKNLMNFKRKFVNYLNRLNNDMQKGNRIKKIATRIYSKINYKSVYAIPLEIIKTFQNMSLDEFKKMVLYRNFLKSILDINLIKKLEFLRENGYSFNDWINKDLRDKFVHDLNIFYVKTEDGLCGAKIILGENRNKVFSIGEYYESLCKLKSLSNFLYNHLFRIEQKDSPDYSHYQISNVKLMKILQKNKSDFPK